VTQYAAKTDVSSDRSRSEIERTLERYGATHFGYMTEPGRAVVAFRKADRQVRFVVPLPDRSKFTRTPTGRVATESAAQSAYEQAVRQRWRALALVVKAKLEAVESGIASFEEEFYAYTLLPSGRTVFEETSEQVTTMISTGMPGRLMLEAGA
jgi:hypothetical protein